jgi:hypothetical protein
MIQASSSIQTQALCQVLPDPVTVAGDKRLNVQCHPIHRLPGSRTLRMKMIKVRGEIGERINHGGRSRVL